MQVNFQNHQLLLLQSSKFITNLLTGNISKNLTWNSSVCPSPWDFICFVENFCVANLAKAALILIVSYSFLFFIYMLYKVGFWHCIIHGLCKLLWALVSCWFYVLSYCCTFFCYDLLHSKRRRRRRNHSYIEDDNSDDDDGSFTYHKSKRECRREERLRMSLRPRSHRVRVGVKKDHPSDSSLSRHGGGVGPVHGLRVSRESKFARKGSKFRTRIHHGAQAERKMNSVSLQDTYISLTCCLKLVRYYHIFSRNIIGLILCRGSDRERDLGQVETGTELEKTHVMIQSVIDNCWFNLESMD